MRLIGGRWRGRKLPVVTAPGLRPSGDRIRETLFNWLTGEVANSHCLDLFAGSGALGFEALSRGASHCDFVELEPQAAAQLRLNVERLEATAEVHATRAEHFVSRAAQQSDRQLYHCVFLDPPFAQALLSEIAAQLEASAILDNECWIYCELGADQVFTAPVTWQLYRQRSSGAVNYRLYRRLAANPSIA